jgi:hypothetical protein
MFLAGGQEDSVTLQHAKKTHMFPHELFSTFQDSALVRSSEELWITKIFFKNWERRDHYGARFLLGKSDIETPIVNFKLTHYLEKLRTIHEGTYEFSLRVAELQNLPGRRPET